MINSKLIKKFVAEALKHLHGKFVIIGGAVLSLVDIDDRVTMDIDFIMIDNSLNGTSSKSDVNEQNLKMMEVAEKLGLPVETINQAGAYFLNKISNYQSHLILVEKNSKCEIYRPDLFLFLQLKLNRLTKSDYLDALSYLNNQIKTCFDKDIKDILKMLNHQKKISKDDTSTKYIVDIIDNISKHKST